MIGAVKAIREDVTADEQKSLDAWLAWAQESGSDQPTPNELAKEFAAIMSELRGPGDRGPKASKSA